MYTNLNDGSGELLQDQGTGGTQAQDRRWAEQYLRENPGWAGNSVWKVENGKLVPQAGWVERNGWVFPAAAAASVFAAPAIGAMSGGGAAAGSGAAGAGTSAGLTATTGFGGMALPGTAVGVGSLGYGAAGAAGAAGAGSAGAAGAAGAAGLSQWARFIPALTTMAGMFMGKGGSGQQQMTPEMREMMQIQLQRMRGQEPLYNDVMGMARSLLPTRYRGAGAGLPGVATPRRDTSAGPSTRGRGGNGGTEY